MHSTRGVARIVKFGLRLATADDDLIASIRKLEELASVRVDGLAPFEKGEYVHVVDGPFRGGAAEVLSCNQQRVILLLNILGKS